jgi:DNA mismatch endonuclease (patch repair protein)
MVDVFSKKKRREIMAKVGTRETRPEKMAVAGFRKAGFRVRLNVGSLPGRPDITIPNLKRAVFVHGCFWHGHENCRRAARPTTNVHFWNSKIDSNIRRDRKVTRALRTLGWHVSVFWECRIRTERSVQLRIQTLINRFSIV